MNIKYPSIENSYREKNLDWIRTIVPADELWEVTEKIHGSNCFLYMAADSDQIQVGKRSGFLKRDENFYGYKTWFERDYKEIKALFEEIHHYYSNYDVQGVTIFGEVFGGIYPHPDVPKNPHAHRVQKGVYYTPNNEFYAFDIMINYNDQDREHTFLSTGIREAFFEKYNLFCAKPLKIGSLDSCLTYNVAFDSTISKQLGFPEIVNNYAEGVVIKPIKNYFFTNGKRVILKNKADKSREKKDRVKTKAVLPEHLISIFETMCQYLTEARFHNVESHEGIEFEFKDFSYLKGLYMKDLMMDFMKENLEVKKELSKPDWKLVNQFLGKEINNNLRMWLKR